MEFSDVLDKRFSCRKFKDMPVETEKIRKLLEAAAMAPTACNKEPQRILVLDEPEKLAIADECTRYGFGAPLNFLFCYDRDVSWHRGKDGVDHGIIDTAIAKTYMMLTAADLGLGTTWVCAFDESKARELFNIPDNYVIEGFLPTGYPAEGPCPMHYKRVNADELTI